MIVLEHQVSADAPRDSCGSILDRVPRKVGVARGRLHLGVTQEPADHREALAEGQGAGRKAVSKVMGWAANEPYIEHRGSSNVSARHR